MGDTESNHFLTDGLIGVFKVPLNPQMLFSCLDGSFNFFGSRYIFGPEDYIVILYRALKFNFFDQMYTYPYLILSNNLHAITLQPEGTLQLAEEA